MFQYIYRLGANLLYASRCWISVVRTVLSNIICQRYSIKQIKVLYLGQVVPYSILQISLIWTFYLFLKFPTMESCTYLEDTILIWNDTSTTFGNSIQVSLYLHHLDLENLSCCCRALPLEGLIPGSFIFFKEFFKFHPDYLPRYKKCSTSLC